jgi:predicted porin
MDMTMKKSLIAFAVLSTFAAAASAQTSVTVYGNLDISAAVYTNTTAAGNKKFKLDSGELSTSRFGLRGTEEIDKDLSARFQVEAQIGVDSGTAGSGSQFFNRRATVGLVSKSMGAVDIGRQTSLDFDAVSTFDPSNYYSSGVTNPNARIGGSVTRFDNSIKYATPSLSGFVVSANYAVGESAVIAPATTATSLVGNLGSYHGLSFAYTDGPLAVIAGASQLNDPVAGRDETKGAYLGGKFAVEPFTIKATFSQTKKGAAKKTVIAIGSDFALDKSTTLTAAFYNTKAENGVAANDAKANEFVGLAKYALSKRTSAYSSLTYVKAGSTAKKDTDLTYTLVAVGKESAVRAVVGVNHTF